MPIQEFWQLSEEFLLQQLKSSREGLSSEEAKARLFINGPAYHKPSKVGEYLRQFSAQLTTPISILLLGSATLSFILGDRLDASIILLIILASAGLGFWQEYGASSALEKLLNVVRIQSWVLRDGREVKIPADAVVPGDITLLSAGSKIPADCRILSSRDLFINEAALTGETFPVEKISGILAAETGLSHRSNCLFYGTHTVSGTAHALVVATRGHTEFAKIANRLQLRPPETDFEQGVRHFGSFLLLVTLLLVSAIFAANIFYDRPLLESFTFSLALAVGLTPQLLPAIISINLAQGAKKMAQQSVIVRRLAAIENFGSMDILCSDKTGTITEGQVQIHSTLDAEGRESEKMLRFAYYNAFFETGFSNPIDEALRLHRAFDTTAYHKIDEIPYDFIRKRLSVLIGSKTEHLLITKGAVDNLLDICTQVETADGRLLELEKVREAIQTRFHDLSQKGFRTLALGYRLMEPGLALDQAEERDLTFLGFLVLHDPIKPNIEQTIAELATLGVSLKIITGDNRGVAAEVARQIYKTQPKLLTGSELRAMSDEALMTSVSKMDVFAEVEPNQKERIILALKKSGHVVGYLGDGINDASALHVADVGISVDQAVDVAKEAADIVLLKRDLAVLVQGVRYGRITFANTLKYVFMASSANFGNMFSMAGASLFLPFLPLLPKQILLTNLLTDLPEMTIATDRVDEEMIRTPRRWNIRLIRNFMLTFGTISSVFDFLTFTALLDIYRSNPLQFRAGWFMESVISAALVVLVIRSRLPIWKSKTSRPLIMATLATIALTIFIPWSPLAPLLGFEPPNLSALLLILGIICLYVLTAESAKRLFFSKAHFKHPEILRPIFEPRRGSRSPHHPP